MSQHDEDIALGVNLDHLVTIREARHTPYPDLLEAIRVAEAAGADGITMHLREDRRHIQTEDVYRSREIITTHMNLEMAATEEMVAIASDVGPDFCCLVPERREELTTEGGLDVLNNRARLKGVCDALSAQNIRVSLFIEPDPATIDAAAELGAPIVELHTGGYANAGGEAARQELEVLERAAHHGARAGLQVNAGHGLHYRNVASVAAIPQIKELNIGHAIIARALMVGLGTAVGEMKALMVQAHGP
jgi:pyridoxine 5-phosphate synthase